MSPNSTDSESAPRKIRKGTTSCWQCKRRKKRCEFGSESTSTCFNCQRFGLTCTSQAFEEPDTNESQFLSQRIDQVEVLVNHLLKQRDYSHQIKKSGALNKSQNVIQRRGLENTFTLNSVSHERLSRGPSLNGYLFSILPDPDTTIFILSSLKLFASPLQVTKKLDEELSHSTERTPKTHLSSNAHPIVLARRLIQLAICLKQFDASSSQPIKLHMNESLDAAAKRFVDISSHLVVSQDYLVWSLDGLDTIMLQSSYHVTIGDFKSAWAIQCRAATIAQEIGLENIAGELGVRAEHLWFQIIYTERFLSLILGVPFAIASNSFASTAQLNLSEPCQKLERIHALIAGHIITRNLRMQGIRDSEGDEIPQFEHYKETKIIDRNLKNATRTLPSEWWLAPPLDSASDSEASEKAARLFAQMHQYYLLALLHHPYLIYYQGENHGQRDYSYSRSAATLASRELLSRYLAVRNYRRSPSYRGLDEKGFMACIILLFAHFTTHGNDDLDFLEHQRSYDLGIIGKVISLWEDISIHHGDLQCASYLQRLRRFIEIEEDAANGSLYHTWIEEGASRNLVEQGLNNESESRFSFPYFGDIVIASQKPLQVDAESILLEFDHQQEPDIVCFDDWISNESGNNSI
ncbi:uncharacterized protein N7483_003579 [Penicillium malachiteum]|uniref:uncharacterized protein n=1 Tax=Penicillium malachiteum TaxID=1324776 RepID=UPI0025465BC4|nr:uncharacterized protein N7483_003579 [Penicillium malachiteum]KAJ5729071.1 hypothetical protein N7483_003579 [Penicillium malachiteum]